MVSYNFTKERRKIYQLHAEGMFFRDIAKVCKISSTRAHQIVKRIEENVPKEELEKIKAKAAHQKK
jgi:DNA-directed RNA polymerase specialized sigma24 family protein